MKSDFNDRQKARIEQAVSILVFGHLPKFYGGRQQSGLANAMWAIATSMAGGKNGLRVTFCATDVIGDIMRVGDFIVYGWTLSSLVFRMLSSPLRTIIVTLRVLRSCIKYKVSFIRRAAKAIILDLAVTTHKPDMLHLHGCDSVIFVDANIFCSKKTIITLHGVHGRSGPLELQMMEKSVSHAVLKLLVFVAKENENEWYSTYGPPASSVVTIPNAFDRTSYFLGDGEQRIKGGVKNKYRLLSVGSVGNNKGQHRVVQAIGLLKKARVNFEVEYVVVGDGETKEVIELLTTARSLGVELTHFKYLHPSEIREQLLLSDFMILPSIQEGFGLVFLESIACGVPVVLPRSLPICGEPQLLSDNNAVFLESASTHAIFKFLLGIQGRHYIDSVVAASLGAWSWEDVGAAYRSRLMPTSQ